MPGNGQVDLNWAPVTGAASYDLYRGTSSGGETLIKTGITIAGYTDTGVTNGTTYYYEVSVVNSAGQSGKSNEAYSIPLAVSTGTWTKQTSPPVSGGTALLLTNGTVLETGSTGSGVKNTWYGLTPSASGSYVNGTWYRSPP